VKSLRQLLAAVARIRPIVGKLVLNIRRDGSIRILVTVVLTRPVSGIQLFDPLPTRLRNSLNLSDFPRGNRDRLIVLHDIGLKIELDFGPAESF
jgi:hypothetical protein